mgnify:CR=1 FL=1
MRDNFLPSTVTLTKIDAKAINPIVMIPNQLRSAGVPLDRVLWNLYLIYSEKVVFILLKLFIDKTKTYSDLYQSLINVTKVNLLYNNTANIVSL